MSAPTETPPPASPSSLERRVSAIPLALRIAPPVVLGGRRAARLVERNMLSYRRLWPALVSGMLEPVFYLFSLGIGLGHLIGTVPGPGGDLVPYAAFVAPGLLAAAAMNGSIIDATFGLFFKLKYAKTYEAVLATPLGIDDVAFGEVSWSLIRGGLYSGVFLIVMATQGTIRSPWGVLAWPACLLTSFAFASVGMACTTYMRSWQDFDFVQLAILPLFLFSATFYPLSTYPTALQAVVWCTPLFHGVDLVRRLALGVLDWRIVVHVAYLATMSAGGLTVVRRRLGVLLLK